MVRIDKNKSLMLEIMCKVPFLRFLKLFLVFTHLKSFKLGFFGMKLNTQHYLVDIVI